jgi:hypothetical protein
MAQTRKIIAMQLFRTSHISKVQTRGFLENNCGIKRSNATAITLFLEKPVFSKKLLITPF